MKYRLYTNSHSAWGGMLKTIDKAKKSIYLEMYILSTDTSHTHDFFSILKEKASQGVEVVIIADIYGSRFLKSEFVEDLRSLGAEFIFFSHFFKRTHRKILIVDKKTAFLGGVNIKEHSRNWRDLQIRITGAPVKLILKTFANSYKRCGGKRESLLNNTYKPITKKIKNWVIDNWPVTNKLYQLRGHYRTKISQAKKSIILMTPYLLPPRWLLAELDHASHRGVNVEIIIPKKTDHFFLDKVNFINACRLSYAGVNFYISKEMNHAKIMIIDEEEVVVGSHNLDILSFEFNYEVGMFSSQKNLVKDVLSIVNKWKKSAKPFNCRKIKISIFDKLLIFFYRIFYPII